jgi:5'-nucleotidase
VLAGCCVGQSPALAEEVGLTVLLVGDTHGHVTAGGPRDQRLEGSVGGVARAAAMIERERTDDPELLLLHAGDTFVGSLFFNHTLGVAELRFLEALGVDAMTVGNHELDLGPQTLALALATAGTPFPVLGANLELSGYPDLGTWIRPSTIREVNGVSVGIFGLTTPDNPLSQPDPVVVLPDLVGVAQAEVDRLRGSGAEVVLCVSHLGMAYDAAIASHVDGIDVILGGHDHLSDASMAVVSPGGSLTPIERAGCFWQHIRRLRLMWDGTEVTVASSTLLEVTDAVPADPRIAASVGALMNDIEGRWPGAFSDVVATVPQQLTHDWDPRTRMRDTDMGNVITDALRWSSGTDIALMPTGLIAEGLPRGPVVPEDLFRTVPYGFD